MRNLASIKMTEEELLRQREETINSNLDDVTQRLGLTYVQRRVIRAYLANVFDTAELVGEERHEYIEYRKYLGLEVN